MGSVNVWHSSASVMQYGMLCRAFTSGTANVLFVTLAAVTLELKKRAKKTKSVYIARTADT